MKKTKGIIKKAFAVCLVGVLSIGNVGVNQNGDSRNLHAAENIKPVNINAGTFPDSNFRAYVREAFDTDKNGTLDVDEVTLARNIYADGREIYSLDGIEHLTQLEGLYASHNHLSELDLSGNQKIKGVWVAYNDFTSLDFSSTKSLEWVYCFYCPKLTNLNVSGNPNMSYIECNSSPVGNLDLSHNPVLEHLMCGDCGMTKLDLSHNPNMQHLDAFSNKLKTLDVTCCPKMKRLDIWNNPRLKSINVSKCPGLQYYNCANNDATSIDVSKNKELTKLICSYNDIKELDVSHNPKLVYLDCADNELTKLDVSNNPALYFLQAFTNKFKTLDIGDNPFLLQTYNEGVKKYEPQVGDVYSWTIDYGIDDSTGGDQMFFLCFDNGVELKTKPSGKVKLKSLDNIDDDVPDRKDIITREVAVQTLYNMANKPSVSGLRSRFKDVESGAWYYDALLWGEKYNICTGYPYIMASEFGTGKALRRQDLALMLMRYAEVAGYRREIDFGRSDDYIDYYDIDYYAWEAVTWVATWHIMEGKGGKTKSEQRIDPHGYVTRSEFIQIIKNMLEVNNVKMSNIPVPNVDYHKYVKTSGLTTSMLKKSVFVSDKKSGGKYKIIKINKKNGKVVGGEVMLMQPYNKKCKKANIKDTVKLAKVKFKITVIADNAFKGCKKLKKITIGKNVRKIGKSAFAGCKKLKNITLKTKKLKKKNVGKDAIKGTSKKLVIRAPKKCVKKYKKIFKNKGNKRVKVK